jgi:hypothetical protein
VCSARGVRAFHNYYENREAADNIQLFLKRGLSFAASLQQTELIAMPDRSPAHLKAGTASSHTIYTAFYRPRETSCRPRTHSHHSPLFEAACFKRPTFTPRTHINHTQCSLFKSNPHTTTEATPFAPRSSIPAYISQSADRRQPTYSQNRHRVHCAPTIGGTIKQRREPTAHCTAPLFTLQHLTSSFRNELSGRN